MKNENFPTHRPRKASALNTKAGLLLILLAGLALLLAGCGGSPSPDGGTDAPDVADSSGERRFLSLGTAPTGGAFFVVGGALAEVAQLNGPSGWSVTAEATQGSQENIRRLAAGELDFALANSAITYFAVRGEATWDQNYEMRAVMTLAPNIALFVTSKDSGIQSIPDLAGKRVVVGPAGAGFEMFVNPLLDASGISYDDFNLLNGPQSAAVDMLADGSADAAFLGGAVPTASIVRASSSMELHYVPYSEEAKASVLAEFPFYRPATIPSGTYRGQDADYAGLDVGSMQLITSAAMDDDTVYAITKAIYENAAAVVERHAAGNAIKPGNVVRDTGTPFHPGAVRFYKEAGIWPDDQTVPEAVETESGS